ncbi:FmdB family zinc ribbon protein [Herminiimonas fonticola]|uniref:Putative FmdB family regulatory protein n=1 Tax=Herminiimonas fonticola TaxID=303380 RepID=A0A4R6GJ72_9BURK|nr:FmdB family zinc ribbon protein [Herminiimonas fonticola]RBA25080.1 putative regulatory protein, FmdB family [Herminiimonas fonticola]TDN94195.1 putative FmdB family regulatory protein [Herminiimonas fonticola]
MPIYAYRCEACAFAKDALQKISDPVLTDCPQCGKSTFKKQLTAAGFQLKGTGWYVTDFRGGQGGTTAPAVANTAGDTSSAAKSDAAASAATPVPVAAAATSAASSAKSDS